MLQGVPKLGEAEGEGMALEGVDLGGGGGAPFSRLFPEIPSATPGFAGLELTHLLL